MITEKNQNYNSNDNNDNDVNSVNNNNNKKFNILPCSDKKWNGNNRL